jgi:MSHA biogenesis protein MshJ
MKMRWQQFAARIDALSLRERVLLFAAGVSLIVFLAWVAGMGPMLRKQALLRAQVSQQQNNLSGMDTEIAQKIADYQRDPDVAARARLQEVKDESAKLGENLRAMQKGLVAPERMAPLIDTILRANGRLKLVSMRTLPVTSLNEPPGGEPAAAPPDPQDETKAKLESIKTQLAVAGAKGQPMPAPPVPQAAPKPGSLLYRHGVEIAVRGNYLDMIDYMNALESLPTQLFWGGAKLEVENYPTSRLTLTMYTLSLDSKWLKL